MKKITRILTMAALLLGATAFGSSVALAHSDRHVQKHSQKHAYKHFKKHKYAKNRHKHVRNHSYRQHRRHVKSRQVVYREPVIYITARGLVLYPQPAVVFKRDHRPVRIWH